MPALCQAGGGPEQMVLGPNHKVGNSGRDRRRTAGANVGFLGAPGRDEADHPLAVGRALPPGNAGPGAFQIQLRCRAVFGSWFGGPCEAGLPGGGAAGSVRTGHGSILPQPGSPPSRQTVELAGCV